MSSIDSLEIAWLERVEAMNAPQRICLCCDKKIDVLLDGGTPSLDDLTYPPNDATIWRGTGNYGSTKLDLMDGTAVEVFVCDECIVKNKHKCFRVKKNAQGIYALIKVKDVFQNLIDEALVDDNDRV